MAVPQLTNSGPGSVDKLLKGRGQLLSRENIFGPITVHPWISDPQPPLSLLFPS